MNTILEKAPVSVKSATATTRKPAKTRAIEVREYPTHCIYRGTKTAIVSAGLLPASVFPRERKDFDTEVQGFTVKVGYADLHDWELFISGIQPDAFEALRAAHAIKPLEALGATPAIKPPAEEPSKAMKEAAKQIQTEGAGKFLALLDMAQKLPEMPITAWAFRTVFDVTLDAILAELLRLPKFSDTAKDEARAKLQGNVNAGFDQISDVVYALMGQTVDRFEMPEAASSALCAMLPSVGAQIRDLFSLYQVRPDDMWTERGIVGFQADQLTHQDDGRAS